MDKVYVAIDLRSFYASVECVELGLDLLNTNLMVADQGRTEKTICLAVSPTLKSYGISGINTYKLISETATGSYGIIYIRDDEDSVHYNEFQIYIFKKGECHYKVDNNLSPCIPEVENGDCNAR